MKAKKIINIKDTWPLRFGGSVTIFMDCFELEEFLDFERRYVFSWIAFDSLVPSRRILIDQHQAKPCHLHVDGLEAELEPEPKSLFEALEHFEFQIKKKFGELS